MRVRNLALDSIQVPEVRITAVLGPELQADLDLSLGQAGQLEPIVVVQKGEAYLLVDGLHRLEAAQRRGDKDIPAVVRPGDEVDALLGNLATSRLKGKVSLANLLQVVDHMVHVLHIDSDRIARETGLSRDKVEQLWRVAEACGEVRQALEEERVSLAVANQVARLPHPAQQREVLENAVRFRQSAKDVKEFVDEVLNYQPKPEAEPGPVQLQPRPDPVCEICGRPTEPRRLTMVPTCIECWGEATRRARQSASTPPPS